jgi:hypothetical protein
VRPSLQWVGGMAQSAALANESGPIQQASSSIWVHPAMDLRGGSTLEMLTTDGFNRRMRKTARPVVWDAHGAQSPWAHPIQVKTAR